MSVPTRHQKTNIKITHIDRKERLNLLSRKVQRGLVVRSPCVHDNPMQRPGLLNNLVHCS